MSGGGCLDSSASSINIQSGKKMLFKNWKGDLLEGLVFAAEVMLFVACGYLLKTNIGGSFVYLVIGIIVAMIEGDIIKMNDRKKQNARN